MRMMLKAVMDTEAGNEAARQGQLLELTQQIVKQLEPEAVYFVAEEGRRGFIAVFDMADSSQIPVIAEPMFLGAKAQLTFAPCMNVEDLERGLAQAYPQGG